MSMTISFPGGAAVDAAYHGHTVHTDQPVASGGADTAVSPFDLVFASLGTCMGYYALRFCQQRHISTEGLAITLDREKEPGGKQVTRVRVSVSPPAGFPASHRAALLRAIDQCAVKRLLLSPPVFDLELSEPGHLFSAGTAPSSTAPAAA